MSTDTPSDCKVSQFSSRGCERGTLGCDVVHGPQVMIESLRRELAAVKAERDKFKALVEEAADDVLDWGSYASDYFREKHDLMGCVNKYRAAAAMREGKE
ncbi:MAG: hypothetical protein HMLKMBBP_01536 [Planctomycetes bacterium]|nr:hypothetical protein [Planctomycetota bacterium]